MMMMMMMMGSEMSSYSGVGVPIVSGIEYSIPPFQISRRISFEWAIFQN